MLLRRHVFIALTLLLALTVVASAQTQTQTKKKSKDKEILSNAPKPAVQLSSHPNQISLCAGDATGTVIPLTATHVNFDKPELLRYRWSTSPGGGEIIGTGANATWNLATAEPGRTHTASLEIDYDRNDGCAAFTTTKVFVKPCPVVPTCPNVSIYCPDTVTLGAPVNFTVNLSGGTPGITPNFNWSITAGTIISGQGTPSISVDTAGLAGQSITASVEVGGYDLRCPANCTVQLPRKVTSTLTDYYPPIRLNDEKARLDNFAIQLQNEPSAKGYIIVYGGRKANAAEKQKRIKRAQDYLVLTRGIDASRIMTMEGGMRDETTTELWIVPLGADPPVIK
jgi:hypothetical protein